MTRIALVEVLVIAEGLVDLIQDVVKTSSYACMRNKAILHTALPGSLTRPGLFSEQRFK